MVASISSFDLRAEHFRVLLIGEIVLFVFVCPIKFNKCLLGSYILLQMTGFPILLGVNGNSYCICAKFSLSAHKLMGI